MNFVSDNTEVFLHTRYLYFKRSTYLNLGFSFVTMPTSISVGLKSTDRTVDRHMMANWGEKVYTVHPHLVKPG
jgi:hypothetical protein